MKYRKYGAIFILMISACATMDGVYFFDYRASPTTEEETRFILNELKQLALSSEFLSCSELSKVSVRSQYDGKPLWRENWSFFGCGRGLLFSISIYEPNIDHGRNVKTYHNRSFQLVSGNSCWPGGYEGYKCVDVNHKLNYLLRYGRDPRKQIEISINQ